MRGAKIANLESIDSKTLKAYEEFVKDKPKAAAGLLARAFQHSGSMPEKVADDWKWGRIILTPARPESYYLVSRGYAIFDWYEDVLNRYFELHNDKDEELPYYYRNNYKDPKKAYEEYKYNCLAESIGKLVDEFFAVNRDAEIQANTERYNIEYMMDLDRKYVPLKLDPETVWKIEDYNERLSPNLSERYQVNIVVDLVMKSLKKELDAMANECSVSSDSPNFTP